VKQVTLNYKSGQLRLIEVPPPGTQPGSVLVRTAFSAISLGTEGMKVSRASAGLLAMARERPDQVKQVIDTVRREGPMAAYNKVMSRLDVPNPLGYSLSGVVTAVGDGTSEFRPGDRVACAGEGIAAHAEMVSVPKNLCAHVPDGVSLEHAAFATVGSIAMQGVRQSSVTVGESVAVIGLGLVGQLAAQIYRAAGCRVFGIDLDAAKCDLAQRMGADVAISRTDPLILDHVLQFTNGRGVDAVLITAATASSDPAQLAVRLCRDRGTVVVLGIVGMEFKFEEAVKKEIQIRLSRSYGPGRYDPSYELHGVDYPIGFVRWTEQRNMESFLQLIAAGSLKLDPIITHRVPFSNAEDAYAKVRDRDAGDVMGVLFEYPGGPALSSRVDLRAAEPPAQVDGASIRIGVIGAGGFARGTLLPILKGMAGVEFRGVANATGLSARHVGDRFGFKYSTGDPREVLGDADTSAVVVATRHDTHGALAIEAMRHGKAVFVEKPLALTREELAAVVAAQRETSGRLMVGFNRRFAPATLKIREIFDRRSEPLVVHYRVNAGFIPGNHWIQDARLGGGRIIGEACHFVDWMLSVVRAPIAAVSAFGMDDAGVYGGDNMAIVLQFSDGSIGNLIYTANGDSSLPKEYVEVSGHKSVAVLDDYRRVEVHAGKRTQQFKLGGQDKGHAAELQAFVAAVRDGSPMPIPFAELVQATDACFAALDSARIGRAVPVGEPAE
jgi:polar amino acid transport system substrate-binding protein